ncbi:hypothetical protein [Antarcticirhabdus aurantiaca]|uniref:Uncharacterized protein n=1 Tax=Antarcticirhabdus aurantiaca TaxID=2606717 RepID=A0ACD4NJW9_9HYPH|nr:hypothetical protein [Antarcticirhabdus aurantiaca]WAJ27175.1 hypothetical protein OXU80_20295 [Jeongeuplla avenae]
METITKLRCLFSADRDAIADEFLIIWHCLVPGPTTDFAGRAVPRRGAKLALPVNANIAVPLSGLGGSSEETLDDAVRYVGTDLSAAAPKSAERRGRAPQGGIRLSVMMRDTDAEALKTGDDLCDRRAGATVRLRLDVVMAKAVAEPFTWPAPVDHDRGQAAAGR